MNGFLDMAMQFQMERAISEMEDEVSREISGEKAVKVLLALKEVLEMLDVNDDSHPVEAAVGEVLVAGYGMYLTAATTKKPMTVALLARNLITTAHDFNAKLRPVTQNIMTQLEEEIDNESL